jgi:hypothetical protein
MMTPFSSKLFSARATVALLRPVPLSRTRPSLVTMPSVSWRSEMLSLVFLKPNVRRMMYSVTTSSAGESRGINSSKSWSGTGVVVGTAKPPKRQRRPPGIPLGTGSSVS